MRARIYLRKQGRKSPTDDSVKRLFAKTKGDFVVSKDDVAAALGRGDEVRILFSSAGKTVPLTTMQCISRGSALGLSA